MIQFEFTSDFRKAYKKRISQNDTLVSRTRERLKLFQLNPNNPILHNHALKGSKTGCRSFWITGDIRIIYIQDDETVYFIDIGTHNQVY